MPTWHPIQTAEPCEWVLRQSTFGEPFGVIRELRFGYDKHMVRWYRLVTWNTDPEKRQLIGYHQDPRVLAQLAWDTMIEDGIQRRATNDRVAGNSRS